MPIKNPSKFTLVLDVFHCCTHCMQTHSIVSSHRAVRYKKSTCIGYIAICTHNLRPLALHSAWHKYATQSHIYASFCRQHNAIHNPSKIPPIKHRSPFRHPRSIKQNTDSFPVLYIAYVKPVSKALSWMHKENNVGEINFDISCISCFSPSLFLFSLFLLFPFLRVCCFIMDVVFHSLTPISMHR